MRHQALARKLVAIIGLAALLPPAPLHAAGAPLPEPAQDAAPSANRIALTSPSSAFQTRLDARLVVEEPSTRSIAKESLLSESAFGDDSSNPSIAAVAIAAAMLGMVAVAVGTAVMQAEVLTD